MPLKLAWVRRWAAAASAAVQAAYWYITKPWMR